MARFIPLELGSARLEEERKNEHCGVGAEKGREMERRGKETGNKTAPCESLGSGDEPPHRQHCWDRSQTLETESFVVLPDSWDRRKPPKRLFASITKTHKESG